MNNCFPIAVQAGQSSEPIQNELQIVGEIADSLIELTADIFAGLRRKVSSLNTLKGQPGGSQQQAQFQSEAEKLNLAQSPNTPGALLTMLSKDESSVVRSALVFNPMLPATSLFVLASDSDKFVSAQARARIQMAA